MGRGALVQLVAYGTQDVYLTGDPQITYFKAVYRRYTNFAIESISQEIRGHLPTTIGTIRDNTTDAAIPLIVNRAPAKTVSVTIARNGDLVGGIHLQTTAGSFRRQNYTSQVKTSQTTVGNVEIYSSCGGAGYDSFLLVDSAELEIGGVTIDKIYGDWMVAYAELVYRRSEGFVYGSNGCGVPTVPNSTTAQPGGIGKMNCMDPLALSLQGASRWRGAMGGCIMANSTSVETASTGGDITCTGRDPVIFIPLLFWFNNQPGLAIPITALQYQNVRLILNLAETDPKWTSLNYDSGKNIKVWVDYIYLDNDERRNFVTNSHEYLITQHQRNIDIIPHAPVQLDYDPYHPGDKHVFAKGMSFSMPLKFNHPCKYLMWWMTGNVNDGPSQIAKKLTLNCMTDSQWTLTVNGRERFPLKPEEYFQHFQVYQHWPCKSFGWSYVQQMYNYHELGATKSRVYPGLIPTGCLPNVYSFAIRPAEHQPSGTCNFSRLSEVKLTVNGLWDDPNRKPRILTVYAENYNILKIHSGMGSIAYSN